MLVSATRADMEEYVLAAEDAAEDIDMLSSFLWALLNESTPPFKVDIG